MAEEVVEIKLDPKIKKEAEEILRKKGITFADAVKIFAEKTVALGTTPFFIKTEKKSAQGILSQYANPALIPQEEGAWERAVVSKYDKNVD